jgi:hypothetical protein
VAVVHVDRFEDGLVRERFGLLDAGALPRG